MEINENSIVEKIRKNREETIRIETLNYLRRDLAPKDSTMIEKSNCNSGIVVPKHLKRKR